MARRRDRPRPERRRRASAPARRARRVVELNATPLPVDDAGPRRARPVRRGARAADTWPAVARARARGDRGDGGRLRCSRSTRSAPPCSPCCRTSRSGSCLDGAQAPKATLTALGAIVPDVVAFRPAPAPGKGLWTTAELPQLKAALTAASGGRAADPPRRAARTERSADLVARLWRAGGRRSARPAEPGDAGGRLGGRLGGAWRARLPGHRGQGAGDRGGVPDRRRSAGRRCSSAATSTASTS